ncbi:unnamed protein product [Pedinophyceae sp. YPF-701]|nr:unnamed protein product [Pedinophyceae sp. YPF-701]
MRAASPPATPESDQEEPASTSPPATDSPLVKAAKVESASGEVLRCGLPGSGRREKGRPRLRSAARGGAAGVQDRAGGAAQRDMDHDQFSNLCDTSTDDTAASRGAKRLREGLGGETSDDSDAAEQPPQQRQRLSARVPAGPSRGGGGGGGARGAAPPEDDEDDIRPDDIERVNDDAVPDVDVLFPAGATAGEEEVDDVEVGEEEVEVAAQISTAEEVVGVAARAPLTRDVRPRQQQQQPLTGFQMLAAATRAARPVADAEVARVTADGDDVAVGRAVARKATSVFGWSAMSDVKHEESPLLPEHAGDVVPLLFRQLRGVVYLHRPGGAGHGPVEVRARDAWTGRGLHVPGPGEEQRGPCLSIDRLTPLSHLVAILRGLFGYTDQHLNSLLGAARDTTTDAGELAEFFLLIGAMPTAGGAGTPSIGNRANPYRAMLQECSPGVERSTLEYQIRYMLYGLLKAAHQRDVDRLRNPNSDLRKHLGPDFPIPPPPGWEDVDELYQQLMSELGWLCPISGRKVPMILMLPGSLGVFGSFGGGYFYLLTVDAKDAFKPHVRGNVQLACWGCNQMKAQLAMLEAVQGIAEHAGCFVARLSAAPGTADAFAPEIAERLWPAGGSRRRTLLPETAPRAGSSNAPGDRQDLDQAVWDSAFVCIDVQIRRRLTEIRARITWIGPGPINCPYDVRCVVPVAHAPGRCVCISVYACPDGQLVAVRVRWGICTDCRQDREVVPGLNKFRGGFFRCGVCYQRFHTAEQNNTIVPGSASRDGLTPFRGLVVWRGCHRTEHCDLPEDYEHKICRLHLLPLVPRERLELRRREVCCANPACKLHVYDVAFPNGFRDRTYEAEGFGKRTTDTVILPDGTTVLVEAWRCGACAKWREARRDKRANAKEEADKLREQGKGAAADKLLSDLEDELGPHEERPGKNCGCAKTASCQTWAPDGFHKNRTCATRGCENPMSDADMAERRADVFGDTACRDCGTLAARCFDKAHDGWYKYGTSGYCGACYRARYPVIDLTGSPSDISGQVIDLTGLD